MENLEIIAVYYGISWWAPRWYVENGLSSYYESFYLFYNRDMGRYYVIFGNAGERIKLDLSNAKIFTSYDDAVKYVSSEMEVKRYVSNIPF